MDQRLHGVVVQGASNSSELTEPVEARRTDMGDVIIQTQVRRKGDTEDANVVTRRDMCPDQASKKDH